MIPKGYIKKKAPLSKIPGEKVSFYQKKFVLPKPFSKQNFNKNDITNISDESYKFVLNEIKDANYGFFIPNSLDQKNLVYGLGGGAQWMGASIDNNKGVMYVPSKTSMESKLTELPNLNLCISFAVTKL